MAGNGAEQGETMIIRNLNTEDLRAAIRSLQNQKQSNPQEFSPDDACVLLFLKQALGERLFHDVERLVFDENGKVLLVPYADEKKWVEQFNEP